MRWLTACALLAGLAAVAAGCGSSHPRAVSSSSANLGHDIAARPDPDASHVGPGPLVPSGAFAGGGESGLLGDTGTTEKGTALGCENRRQYSYAFGLVNKSKAPVTLTSVRAANPVPKIVDRVATQLRLSPPQPPPPKVTNGFGQPLDLVYRHWSKAPTRPVTIPPGRIVTVQSNFLMSHCSALSGGRTITIPARFVFRYRTSGPRSAQVVSFPADRIVVGPGPVRRMCDAVPGSAHLVAANLGCVAARKAAQRCNTTQRGGGLCTVSGRRTWECGRFEGPGWPLYEICYLPHDKSRWFSTVWIEGGLGLWGAIQNEPEKSVTAPQAGPPTGGACRVSPGTLAYESTPLALRRVDSRTRTTAGKVTFLIRGYHGPGTYWATAPVPGGSTAVQLVGTSDGTYRALVGHVEVDRVTKHAVSGVVYVYLRQSDGTKRVSLNGTWSCRTGD